MKKWEQPAKRKVRGDVSQLIRTSPVGVPGDSTPPVTISETKYTPGLQKLQHALNTMKDKAWETGKEHHGLLDHHKDEYLRGLSDGVQRRVKDEQEGTRHYMTVRDRLSSADTAYSRGHGDAGWGLLAFGKDVAFSADKPKTERVEPASPGRTRPTKLYERVREGSGRGKTVNESPIDVLSAGTSTRTDIKARRREDDAKKDAEMKDKGFTHKLVHPKGHEPMYAKGANHAQDLMKGKGDYSYHVHRMSEAESRVTCPTCKGYGARTTDVDAFHRGKKEDRDCPQCKGEGDIPKEPVEEGSADAAPREDDPKLHRRAALMHVRAMNSVSSGHPDSGMHSEDAFHSTEEAYPDPTGPLATAASHAVPRKVAQGGAYEQHKWWAHHHTGMLGKITGRMGESVNEDFPPGKMPKGKKAVSHDDDEDDEEVGGGEPAKPHPRAKPGTSMQVPLKQKQIDGDIKGDDGPNSGGPPDDTGEEGFADEVDGDEMTVDPQTVPDPGQDPMDPMGAGEGTKTVQFVLQNQDVASKAIGWLRALGIGQVNQEGAKVTILATSAEDMLLIRRTAQAFGLELSEF